MSQQGLLMIAVSPKQAARAIRAAYGEETYRAGGEIFQDTPDGWFRPIGILKFAGDVPAEPFPPPEGEHEVNIAKTATAVARKIKQAVVGPPEFSDEQVADSSCAEARQRLGAGPTTGWRVTARNASPSAPPSTPAASEYGGLLPTAAREQIDDQLRGASARLAKAERSVRLCAARNVPRRRLAESPPTVANATDNSLVR